jgi:hypothetical protein
LSKDKKDSPILIDDEPKKEAIKQVEAAKPVQAALPVVDQQPVQAT